MATYTLDWSETDLGGSAVTSYARGTLLDFTDKPVGATSALSCTAAMGAGDHMLAVFSIETSGSSVMTFDYHVSTEAGWDKLHIDVDGVSQANYSGIVAWTSHPGISIPSAGVHTIRFRYSKDAGDMNADRVWIANLNITNTVTVNDSTGTVDTHDLEDGAIPAVVSTASWTNSTSAPIAGTRSLRSPASPAHGTSYDLTITKPAGDDYGTVGFDYKTSTESGWDKLQVFPDPLASGKAEFSGVTSGHLAIILPATESSVLVRYIKDGGGSFGSDAVWIDNLTLPAAGGAGPTTHPAAGTVAGTSSVAATARAILKTAGTVAAVSAVAASATIVPKVHTVSGTVATSSGVSASATRLPRTLTTSGTVAAITTVSASASVIGGPVTHSAAGVVAVVSGLSAQATARLKAAGTAAASSTVAASASLLAAPVVYPAAGRVDVVSGVAGTVTYTAGVAGRVDAVSGVSGAASIYDPDAPVIVGPRVLIASLRIPTTYGVARTPTTYGTARIPRATGVIR